MTVRRGVARALRGVSWSVRDGEVWAIVGPNGAGKSTLASAVRGEVALASGEIVRRLAPRGRRAREPWEEVGHVSFSAQRDLIGKASGYHQSRWHAGEDAEVLTAGDFLAGAAARRAARTLGLGRLLGTKLTELSNGERRKVQLAAALAEAPDLLFIDNPFTGLDAASRAGLLEGIRALCRSGQRLVIITARAEEVPPGATHVLCLARGRALASGPRDEVLRLREVRAALRAPPAQRRAAGRPAARARGSASPPPAVIELERVTVRAGGKALLRDVSWTVRRGERWAVLGPNGAGKSTLLSLIVADNPQAYACAVTVFGARRGEGTTIWELKRRIGFVSPELHLFLEGRETALEAVASGLRDTIGIYRACAPAEARRAASWLRRVGLARARDRAFRSLSEGEQRLVLLARALVKEPDLLVLDEPCQGLDASARERFIGLLEALTRTSTATLIHVTHEADELPATITHALVLGRGRVASQGPLVARGAGRAGAGNAGMDNPAPR